MLSWLAGSGRHSAWFGVESLLFQRVETELTPNQCGLFSCPGHGITSGLSLLAHLTVNATANSYLLFIDL